MKTTNKAIIIFVLIFIISFFLDQTIISSTSKIKNPILDLFFGWFSLINLIIFFLLVSILLLVKKKIKWIVTIWGSIIISGSISLILKIIIARPRPIEEIFYPLINIISYSFPSTHTTLAFSTLPILIKQFPKLKWLWILLAIIVGFSRIYFNAHFLSDVIFGAFLGYLIGLIIIRLKEKYKFL